MQVDASIDTSFTKQGKPLADDEQAYRDPANGVGPSVFGRELHSTGTAGMSPAGWNEDVFRHQNSVTLQQRQREQQCIEICLRSVQPIIDGQIETLDSKCVASASRLFRCVWSA